MIHACCSSVIIVMEMYFILLVQMRNLRWLDTLFLGSIPPKIEHELRRHEQRFEKIATTVDQNLL